MTTVDPDAIALTPSEHQIQLRRAVIASTIGTAIEWYDFFLYSTVTGLKCPTGDWFESYEPSSLLCLRDAFDMTGCLERSSSPLRPTTHSHANRDFRRFVS